MENSITSIFGKKAAGWRNNQRINEFTKKIEAYAPVDPTEQPVVIFNASTRLTGISLNAAFSLLTGWSLRLAGVPVKNFVCQSGMSHCILGTNREDYHKPPPCKSCIAQSRRLYARSDVSWYEYEENSSLSTAICDLNLAELSAFEYNFNSQTGKHLSSSNTPNHTIPFGEFVLPSIRWALRCHNLKEDEDTRYLLREYILSAFNVAHKFAALLDEVAPSCVLIFNGTMYPEAVARWVALQRGIKVITHEVGFQPFSTIFSTGKVTAYPIHIPNDFELTLKQNTSLDAYLEKRFQGKFTMAGIRFWPEMRGLDNTFLEKASLFKQIIPVFTNVVYDTSQVHANQIFPHMFAWLDTVLDLIHEYPESLFVIRAHPDEMRPGTAKQSRQSVRDWVIRNGIDHLDNVVFIDSQDYINSYELIQSAKFVLVYNSSIGMEATLLDKPVLCGGKARYTQYPIVFLPDTPQAFIRQAQKFLTSELIELPTEFQRNARRFLYYQLFRASLPFEEYIQEGNRKGFVYLRSFPWPQLLAENSTTMEVLQDNILSQVGGDTHLSNGETFLLPETR
ncbi:hypothetical protein ACFLUC_02240 [Chloroflexota bacterium]